MVMARQDKDYSSVPADWEVAEVGEHIVLVPATRTAAAALHIVVAAHTAAVAEGTLPVEELKARRREPDQHHLLRVAKREACR